MLYQVYNLCSSFLPSLELKPLTESTPKAEVIDAMRKLIKIAQKLSTTKAENRATYELQYDYLSFEDLDEEAVAAAFNEIHIAFIDDFGKKPMTVVVDPIPRRTFPLHAPKWKYPPLEAPIEPRHNTMQIYKKIEEEELVLDLYRVLFHRYITIEKRYHAWYNSLTGKNLNNELPYKSSGSAEILFPYLLDFAKTVSFDTLGPFLGADRESMEMATLKIQSLSAAPATADVYEVLLEYVQTLEIVMDRIDPNATKKFK
jgi:hypothetical protein